MGNLASLTLMLGANIGDFQTKMRKASKTLERTGKQMKAMGKSMSMYVTAPIVALGGASLAAFDKQIQAEQKLAAQLRANGKDVQSTMSDYKAFASSLQDITTVGDETTLALMQMAESMQSSDSKEAAKDAIGLSKALGIDLKSALKMVVLAQDGEYTMLNRYVPALRSATSETQKAAIVHKLYSDGMKIAQAEAKNGLGPLKQLKNSMGDLMESFGKIIAEAIQPFVTWLKKMVDKFQQLSPKGKKMIAIFAGIAAAIGPVLVIFGTMVSMLPAIASGFALITGPVGIAVAAIAAIGAAFVYVYGNWQALKDRLTDWNWLKNALIDVTKFIAKALTVVWRPILKLIGADFITPAIEQLDKLKVPVDNNKTAFKSFGQTIKDVVKQAMDAMGLFSTSTQKSLNNVGTAATKAAARIKEVISPMATKGENITVTNNQQGQLKQQPNMGNTVTGLQQISAELQTMMDRAGAIADIIGNVLTSAFDAALTNSKDFFKVLLKGFADLLKKMVAAVAAALALAAIFALITGGAGNAGQLLLGKGGLSFGKLTTGLFGKMVGIPGLASGGIVPPGFPNDSYPAMLSSGEMIVPAAQPLPAGGNLNINISGTFRQRGSDLVAVIERTQIQRERVRGY